VYRGAVKPSPVPSILLFVGALFLIISLLGRGWSTYDSEGISANSGPVWGTVCMKDFGDEVNEKRCETHHFLKDLDKGKWGGMRLIGFLFVLMALTGMVMTPIAGGILLKKQKSALALMTLIFVGGALLLFLIVLLYALADSPKHFELPGYGFFLFLVGSIAAVVGSIMAMSRARGMSAGQLPRPYPMQGQQPYPPQQQPYPPQGQPYQQAPQQQNPYAPGAQPQQPYNPQQGQQAQQGPAHPTCGTPMQWAAQYNRWFCPRCNQYG
jgi:hypothetical protein